jgi:hypothetical protein
MVNRYVENRMGGGLFQQPRCIGTAFILRGPFFEKNYFFVKRLANKISSPRTP